MKVLVVYELIPEDTTIFVEEVSGEELEKLKECHGRYVNINMADDLSDWLSEWIDKQAITLAEANPIDIADCELFVHTGFAL